MHEGHRGLHPILTVRKQVKARITSELTFCDIVGVRLGFVDASLLVLYIECSEPSGHNDGGNESMIVETI